MNESRGWVRDRDLFGGREIGHSDQVSFLILRVQRLLLRECRSFCGVATFDALAASEPSSVKKRPDGGAERVVSDCTKRQIQSVDFVQGLRAKRSPDRPLRRTIALSTAIASRKVVDLRSLTARRLKCQPKSWLGSVRSPASRGCEVHNPLSLQCKGKRINGAENFGQRTAVTVGHLSRS